MTANTPASVVDRFGVGTISEELGEHDEPDPPGCFDDPRDGLTVV